MDAESLKRYSRMTANMRERLYGVPCLHEGKRFFVSLSYIDNLRLKDGVFDDDIVISGVTTYNNLKLGDEIFCHGKRFKVKEIVQFPHTEEIKIVIER